MKLARRKFPHLAAGAVALPAVSRVARAQTYPTRPITMIVPLAAGGGIDVLGRIVADQMTRSLGQPVIFENVSGADGTIGTGRVAQAPMATRLSLAPYPRTCWPALSIRSDTAY